MNRIRWFRLGTKGEFNSLARQLSSQVFALNEPVSSGFRIEKKNKTGLIGQFIHKRTVDQVLALPSGEEFTQEVATIEITKFEIDTSFSNILLNTFDAPRSLTSFFSALSVATKFTCTIDPLEVDVEKWIQHISEDRSAIAITYLDIAGIVVSGEVQARVALSGTRDVYGAMHEFLGEERKGTIEIAKVCFHFDGATHVLELGRRATLKVPAGFSDCGIKVIREAMLASLIQSAQ